MNRLCRIERFRLQGMGFETWISRTDKGHYSAMTRLGIGDRVISDAPSEDEALRTHLRVLPLALMARGLLD